MLESEYSRYSKRLLLENQVLPNFNTEIFGKLQDADTRPQTFSALRQLVDRSIQGDPVDVSIIKNSLDERIRESLDSGVSDLTWPQLKSQILDSLKKK